MQNIRSAEFGIIISDEEHCTVWPKDEKPPSGWRFTASRGTKAQMQARVDQQFVPTAPAMQIELDRRYKDAEWAVAEFED
jgi:uncharacterized protein YbdZ (MbtH family)